MYIERDLSLFHEPVSYNFLKFGPIEWEKFRFSDEQIEHFREKGYVSNIKLLEESQVEQIIRNCGK